jgi:methionine-gamma-lyase
MPNPHTAWLLTRSLETLKIRAEAAAANAQKCAEFLVAHPKVRAVSFLGLLKAGDPEFAIYQKQQTGPGSLISLFVKGGEAEAFRFLDALEVMKLAVSLGGTETLISHSASTTHSGVPKATRDRLGVTDSMIRISVGIEDPDDLIADLEQALATI